jgi:hypothetical protein
LKGLTLGGEFVAEGLEGVRRKRWDGGWKREPATPAAWPPKLVIALPAGFVSFSKAKKKEPKKSAFSSLAACRSSRESDQSGSAPSHERSRLFLPVQCRFIKTYWATPPEPPPPLCQLLSLERLNAGGGLDVRVKVKRKWNKQISLFEPFNQK